MVGESLSEAAARVYVCPVNDDWRLEIEAGGSGGAMVEQLSAKELEHDLDMAFGERVIVSRDDETVFLYAGDRKQAELAAGLVERLARDNDLRVSSRLRHWHPDAEEWEDPDAPLPADAGEREAEHQEAIADERAEVQADGDPRFEVRVELDSHRAAVDLGKRLEAEGIPAVRRWRYLVVGAGDEDAAQELASRLREEAPAGSAVSVEGSGQIAREERPPNPFAIFGGLGT